MPGITGLAFESPRGDMQKHLEAMLKRMTYREDYLVSHKFLGAQRIALGKADPDILTDKKNPSQVNASSLFDGEIYNGVDLSPSEWVREENFNSLRSLDGTFAFAFLDETQGLLFLVSDKFGSKPLYYTLLSEGFAFASEVKSLLVLPEIGKKPNMQALADCYRFGFVLGNKTLFSGIHLLPPASILSYNIQTKEIKISSYWDLTEIFSPHGKSDLPAAVDEVVESFGISVKKRLGQIEKIGISLSGGLDSRAILAAMEEESRGISTYTLGLPGCQDEKLSAQLAKLAQTTHAFLEIGPKYLGDFLELANTLVLLSDGFYHPHESTEKRALDYFRQAPFRIALRGHGGEIAKASLAYPVQVNNHVLGLQNANELNEFIYNSSNLGIRDISPAFLFQAEVLKEFSEGARNSLEAEMQPAGHKLSPADQCIYFYIQQWIRRQVFASLAIFRTQLEIRLPYLDEFFLQKLLSLPVSQRYAGEIHTRIVQRYFPAMVKVINSNTGAPLDAGMARLFLTEKFNALLKRLSLPGFRHYTEFQQWQREQFRTSIEKIIFDRKTFSRGLYRQEGLRQIFNLHVSGKKNYAHLLGTIVGLELWFRNFVD